MSMPTIDAWERADDFVVLVRSRRQLELVVLPKLREFPAAVELIVL